MSRTADVMAKVTLLRKAEEVFAERGLADAKVEEITRRAGLSKGAFYLHFESKEEAFRQVVESFLARCSALIPAPGDAENLPDDPHAVLEFMREQDRLTFEFFWQNRALLRIVDDCTGAHRYVLDAFLEGTKRNAESWISALRARGLFRDDVDAGVAATMICGGYRELVRRMVSEEKAPPIARVVDDAQRLFISGLGADALVDALRRPAPAREPRPARRVSGVAPASRPSARKRARTSHSRG